MKENEKKPGFLGYVAGAGEFHPDNYSKVSKTKTEAIRDWGRRLAPLYKKEFGDYPESLRIYDALRRRVEWDLDLSKVFENTQIAMGGDVPELDPSYSPEDFERTKDDVNYALWNYLRRLGYDLWDPHSEFETVDCAHDRLKRVERVWSKGLWEVEKGSDTKTAIFAFEAALEAVRPYRPTADRIFVLENREADLSTDVVERFVHWVLRECDGHPLCVMAEHRDVRNTLVLFVSTVMGCPSENQGDGYAITGLFQKLMTAYRALQEEGLHLREE